MRPRHKQVCGWPKVNGNHQFSADGADSSRNEEAKRASYPVAASHRVPRVMPENTDLIPTHGEPESVKEDPMRCWSLWRSKKASAGSRDLALQE